MTRQRQPRRIPEKLIVLYDDECRFCHNCKGWLLSQPQEIPLEFVAAHDAAVPDRFPGIERHAPTETLTVVDDRGLVYSGEAAMIMCLFALHNYRSLSYKLALPGFRGMVRGFFEKLSGYRQNLSGIYCDC